MSVVSRPSSVLRCRQFTLNDNTSYTIGAIFYKKAKTNFIRQKTWLPGGVAYRGNKNFKIFSSETCGQNSK